jgi:hypothetical protein
MKKVSKAQAAKIAEVLKYAELLRYEFVTTYDGGTYPYIVDVQSIFVSPSGQFVTIDGGGSPNSYISRERFNVNDSERSKDLNYTLSVILRAYKSAARYAA